MLVAWIGALTHESQAQEKSKSQGSARKKVICVTAGAKAAGSGISGMGSISCPRVLDLGFDDSGVVAEIFVEEGDLVRQGQVLAKLDSSVLEAEKASLQTKLASGIAEVNFFKTELAKRENLFRKDAVSETELRKVTFELEKAQAQLEHAKAEITTIDVRLKKRILVAPIPGIISQRHVDVGSVIMPSSYKVVSLIHCRTAFAEVELGEKLFPVAKLGETVRVKVDALGGKVFEGKVVRIAPQIDKKNRTFILRVAIDNPDWGLRPGMFVRADIDSGSGAGPIWIPKSAVRIEGSTAYAFVVKNSVALRRNVQVGMVMDNKIEIIKGISQGEPVVVEGQDRISDMDEVSAEMSENGSEHE